MAEKEGELTSRTQNTESRGGMAWIVQGQQHSFMAHGPELLAVTPRATNNCN